MEFTMQASPRTASAAFAHVDRIVTAIGAGGRLLVLNDLCWSKHWPQLPTGWTVVPDSGRPASGERFAAYARDGAIITLRAVRDAAPEPTGRMIALMTLAPRRVAIAEAGPDRFDARWTCGDVGYRLTAGPTTLAAFMRLLLSIGWR
jgi:hypothetical protein